MAKLVCGVGLNDCSGWGSSINKGTYEYRVYRTWHGMITRCYSDRFQNLHPTYKGCTVCDRWLTLSNFAEDIKKIPNYDLWVKGINSFLDKDIRVPGNKVYSPITCMFVTPSESMRDVNINHPGNTHSKEANEKMGKTNSRKVIVINIVTGEDRIFESQKEAGEILGISQGSISEVISGKREQAGGYYFERV